MNVLSLFDGMSGGQIALTNMGVKIDNYYASEIDKHAIAQTQLNFPNTKQLGSVTEWQTWDIDWSSINILFAGSPCQGFSFAGKQLAFDDPRSKLFFVFVDILKHIRKFNPNVLFLLENVKMKAEHEAVITQYCGVKPIKINSALLSAQNRVRLYWTNIGVVKRGLFDEYYPGIPQPKDKGILLRDILETEVPEKYYISHQRLNTIASSERKQDFISVETEKHGTLISGYAKIPTDGQYLCVASRGRNPENPKSRVAGLPTEQQLEPRNDGKTNCLTSVQKDNLVMQINPSKESGGQQPYQQNRVYDSNGISPALCANKADLLIKLGNIYPSGGENGNVFSTDGKSPTIKSGETSTTGNGGVGSCNSPKIASDYRIRRLTPTECARLQTIPTWYKWQCSDTQQYRMLGNGWTNDVIQWILSFAKF